MSVGNTAQKCLQTIFLVAVLLAINPCDCKTSCDYYDYYQEMERALISDTKNLFKLQQIFFPTLVNRVPQDKVTIKVCILISNDQKSNNHSTAPTERCLVFDYSTTLLTAMITPAQLYAFESITTLFLIKAAVRFSFSRGNVKDTISLHMTYPCNVMEKDLYNNLAILTSWVRYSRRFEVPSL